MPAILDNSAVAARLKKTFSFQSQRKAMPKNCSSNYCTVGLVSHASKVMLKIPQTRVQQYMNRELQDVQAGFRKYRGTRVQIANVCWIIKKAREFQKNIYFCFTDYMKVFDCEDHNKLWKLLQELGIQITLPASWETCMQAKKQQSELDMEERVGSNWERSRSMLYDVTLLI